MSIGLHGTADDFHQGILWQGINRKSGTGRFDGYTIQPRFVHFVHGCVVIHRFEQHLHKHKVVLRGTRIGKQTVDFRKCPFSLSYDAVPDVDVDLPGKVHIISHHDGWGVGSVGHGTVGVDGFFLHAARWFDAAHQLHATRRWVEMSVAPGRVMRTCWVLDHPAHVRLLAELLRNGTTADLIVACDRHEVRSMMEHGDGRLPRRQTLWVPRPVGNGRRRKALYRLRTVQRTVAAASKDGQGPVERVVSVGAPLELLATKPRWFHRSGVRERWYITDTEVNHLAHRLASKAATTVVVPTHWREDLDDGFLADFKGRVHRLDGLHGHVHLAPFRRPSKVSSPPRVLVRRLEGDGVHDADELVPLPSDALDGLSVTAADEGQVEGDPWDLVRKLASHDGVITQSVTLASEAVLLGTPALLISKAERGFLDRLESEGAPLFRWRGELDETTWTSVHAQFLAGLHLTDALEPMDWPDAQQTLLDCLTES